VLFGRQREVGLLWSHFKTAARGHAHVAMVAGEPGIAKSLLYLAYDTQRVHYGPLVAPLSFRDPLILAHQAAAVDALSAGQLIFGLGAGWAERATCV